MLFQLENEGGIRNFGPAITALYDCHLIPRSARNDKVLLGTALGDFFTRLGIPNDCKTTGTINFVGHRQKFVSRLLELMLIFPGNLVNYEMDEAHRFGEGGLVVYVFVAPGCAPLEGIGYEGRPFR